MFSELGHLLPSSFTFLWCYVTPPGLLALLTVCLLQLHQRAPAFYIAWNSSAVRPPAPRPGRSQRGRDPDSLRPQGPLASFPDPGETESPASQRLNPTPTRRLPPTLLPSLRLQSQEVKQPYLRRTLDWVTFLGILTFLPIPVQPLHHWWHLKDHIASDPFEKLQSKKVPLAPSNPLQCPKQQLVKSPERDSDSSSRKFNLPLMRRLNLSSGWRFSLPWSRTSQNSSWFSLPVITPLTSALSVRPVSIPSSRRLSPALVTTGDSDKNRETREEKQKAAQ